MPDLAGWGPGADARAARHSVLSTCTDWACEVLSALTRRLDLQGKRPIYAREGVAHLWLVDPTDRTPGSIRAPRWGVGAHRLAKDDEPVSIRPFDAITFSLGDLGSERRPRIRGPPGSSEPEALAPGNGSKEEESASVLRLRGRRAPLRRPSRGRYRPR